MLKIIILLFYTIPLFLPWAYSLSMLGLSIILFITLLYYCIKRIKIFRGIQKNTDIDLSGFMRFHFSLTEREKYMISREELAGSEKEAWKKAMQKNQELFEQISPELAKEFFICNGKIFILRIWLIVTVVLSMYFSRIL